MLANFTFLAFLNNRQYFTVGGPLHNLKHVNTEQFITRTHVLIIVSLACQGMGELARVWKITISATEIFVNGIDFLNMFHILITFLKSLN